MSHKRHQEGWGGRIWSGMALGLVLLNGCATTSHESFTQPAALPTIQTVSYDEHGHILVNGKPFFPILIYDAPADPTTLKMLHDQGFNTLSIGKPEEADALPSQGFYGAAHVPGKVEKLDGILFGIGMDSPALNWKEDLMPQLTEDCAKVRTSVPGRLPMHAIGYWEDEPEGVKTGKLPRREKYEDVVQAIEVAAPYLYPVPYQPIASVGDAVARAKAATGGKKPVIPILQLFVWEAKDRYPTSAELKCMVYLSLIEHADGIGFYSYGYVTGKEKTNIAAEQPVLWQAVKGINVEAATIGAFFADSSANAEVNVGEGTPEVKMRSVKNAGGTVVLLANTAAAAKSVTLQVPASVAALKRLDGGKDIPASGGKATVELQPSEAVGLRF